MQCNQSSQRVLCEGAGCKPWVRKRAQLTCTTCTAGVRAVMRGEWRIGTATARAGYVHSYISTTWNRRTASLPLLKSSDTLARVVDIIYADVTYTEQTMEADDILPKFSLAITHSKNLVNDSDTVLAQLESLLNHLFV